MPGIDENQPEQKSNNQPENTNAATNSQKNSQIDVNIKILTVNVFFDGTLNNMYNSDLRTKPDPSVADIALQKKLVKPETSYVNDLSNVALLFKACSKSEGVVEKIYIQGSGTTMYEEDDLSGYAFSKGKTGVYARVNYALHQVAQKIRDASASIVLLNVFGFSRGSFFARYFCAKVKAFIKNGDYMDDEVVSVVNGKDVDVYISFVGLYDTVSSYGMIGHYSNVKPFQLNTGANQVDKEINIGNKHIEGRVVHLTAQNDYRYHFPLTHIDTAIGDGIGFECSFPGAHSDIGGGYTANASEDVYLSPLKEHPQYNTDEIYWEWFKEKGYYSGNPQSENLSERGNFVLQHAMPSDPTSSYVVYARRKVFYKDYQFILANGMKKIAEEEGIKFNGKEKNILERGIAEMQNCSLILQMLDQYVCQYLLDHYKKAGFYEIELTQAGLSFEQQKQLYHDYLHNSLVVGDIGNRGIDAQTNPPKRAEIHDNT